MKLLLLPAAREDIEEARAWYASTAPHVQGRFDVALADTIEHALQWPRAFPVVYRGGLRRALVTGFPYQLFYRLRSDAVVVVALTHSARHPRVWKRRS
jgi:toxin ParE1/3/4